MFKNNFLFTTPIDNYYTRDLHRNASYPHMNQAHFANRNFDEEAFSNLKPEIDYIFNLPNHSIEAKSGLNKADYNCSSLNRDATAFSANFWDCDSSPSFFPRGFSQSGATSALSSFTQYDNYNYLKQNKNINYPQKDIVDAKFSDTENNYNSNRNSQKSFQNLALEAQPKSLDIFTKKGSFDSLALSFSDKSTADEVSFCLATKNLNINQKQEPAIDIFSKNQTRTNNNFNKDYIYNNNNSNIPNNYNPNNNHSNHNKTKPFLEFSQIKNSKDSEINVEHNNNYYNQKKKTYLENFKFSDLINEGLNLNANLNRPMNTSELLTGKECKIIEDEFYQKNNFEKFKINIINNYFELKKQDCEIDNHSYKSSFNKNNIINKNSNEIISNYSRDKLSKSDLDLLLQQQQHQIKSPSDLNKNKLNNKIIKNNYVNKTPEANSELFQNKSVNEVINVCPNGKNNYDLKQSSDRKISEFSEEVLMNSVYSFSSEKYENSTLDKEINSINDEVICKEVKEKIKITEIFKINWKKCIDIYKKFSLNSYKEILLHPKETKTNSEANKNKTTSAKGNLAKNNKKNKNKNKAKNLKLTKNDSDPFKNSGIINIKTSSDSIFNYASALINESNSALNLQKPEKNQESERSEVAYKLNNNCKNGNRTNALSGESSDATICTQITQQTEETPFLIKKTENNLNNKNFNSDLENLDTEETNSNNNNENNDIISDKRYNSLENSSIKNINADINSSYKNKKKKKNNKNKNNENPNYLRRSSIINTNYNNFNICNPIVENQNYFKFNYVNFNGNNNDFYGNMQINSADVANNYPNLFNNGNFYNYNSSFNFVPNSFIQIGINNNYSNKNFNNYNPNFVNKERKPFGF